MRTNTSPADFHGMVAAQGILTSRGGLVSHAAVVARGLGKPAVCGAEEFVVDRGGTFATVGSVPDRARATCCPSTARRATSCSVRCRSCRRTRPRNSTACWPGPTNCAAWRSSPTPTRRPDATAARAAGATGIGLCRTEHQFLGDRLPLVQDVILAETRRGARRGAERTRIGAAARLRGTAGSDGRTAGHGAAARPAVARIPARPRRTARGRSTGRLDASRTRSCSRRRSPGGRSTRCSASGVCASGC